MASPIIQAFSHVRVWVFDLDNTLYHPSAGLFDQVGDRMTAYVAAALGVDRAEATRLRDHYWRTHGTTLAGLMQEHGLDPDPYLADVHDIDFAALTPDPVLADRIAALPGRRIVHTNGSVPYARAVLAARGLGGVFDAVYGVESAGYLPKPDAAAYAAIRALDGHDPGIGAMFEDDPRNLAVPHELGMRTVLVGEDACDDPHIGWRTDDLADFLARVI